MRTNVDCMQEDEKDKEKLSNVHNSSKHNKTNSLENNNNKEKKNLEEVINNNNNINNIIAENNEIEEIKENLEIKENNEINENLEINNIINNQEEAKNEEDPVITHINSNRKIEKKNIENSTKIIIEEEGEKLFGGAKIEINAGGMVGGRGVNDGFAIFGQKQNLTMHRSSRIEEKKDENDNKIFKPDLEINCDKLFNYPYIFAIYFNNDDKKFYIRAYSGKGSENKILFLKLTEKYTLKLKQKELISCGDIIFQVMPLKEGCIEIINLSKKKYMPQYRQIFDGFNNKNVTIGRHKDCDISFPKDKSISRFQTTFEFDEENKEWTIIDGKKDKPSTNGTWVFGIHSFVIKEEMIVEILNSKIIIKEVKNEDDKV